MASKKNTYKYIKDGKIKGLEIVEKPIKEFLTEYPILDTIYIMDENGKVEPKESYSRSGLIYRFNDEDMISIKKPTRNEYFEILKYTKENPDADDLEIMELKINDEPMNAEALGNMLSTKEYQEFIKVVANFIIDLKVIQNY